MRIFCSVGAASRNCRVGTPHVDDTRLVAAADGNQATVTFNYSAPTIASARDASAAARYRAGDAYGRRLVEPRLRADAAGRLARARRASFPPWPRRVPPLLAVPRRARREPRAPRQGWPRRLHEDALLRGVREGGRADGGGAAPLPVAVSPVAEGASWWVLVSIWRGGGCMWAPLSSRVRIKSG